jgi:hypothetical protein
VIGMRTCCVLSALTSDQDTSTQKNLCARLWKQVSAQSTTFATACMELRAKRQGFRRWCLHLLALERAGAKVLDGLLGLCHHDGLCGHAEARAAGGANDKIGGAERWHKGRGLRHGGSLPDNVAQNVTRR